MSTLRIRDNLLSVRERIAAAAGRSGRDASAVPLVAVTKKRPPELVRPLLEAGVRDLGEVERAAAGFTLAEVVEMPANNLTVVLRRR